MKIASRRSLMFLIPAFVFAGQSIFIAVPALAQNPMELIFSAKPTGKPMERKLSIVLKDGGKPVVGAHVEVDVDMPSMPMMHHVPKTKAEPGGTPGEYSAIVAVEMPGEWAARIVVDKPRRTTAVHKFQVD